MRLTLVPRTVIALLLAAALALSGMPVIGARPVHAAEDSPVVSTAMLLGLIGLGVYLVVSGRELIVSELEERGCPVPDLIGPSTLADCRRRSDYLNAHPDTDPRVAELILYGRFAMGMTAAEVEASIGPPTTINRSVTAYGATEQWVYRTPGGYSANYLYLDDGILRSWQVSR